MKNYGQVKGYNYGNNQPIVRRESSKKKNPSLKDQWIQQEQGEVDLSQSELIGHEDWSEV